MTSELTQFEQVIKVVSQLTQSTKRKYILSRFLSIVFVNLSFLLWTDDLISLTTILLIVIAFSAISTILILNRKKYKNINQVNVLEHINRLIPEYQESSQVILSNDNISLIKSILKERVIKQLLVDEQSGLLKKCMPAFQWKLLTLFILFFLFSIYSANNIKVRISTYFLGLNKIEESSQIVPSSIEITTIDIQQAAVNIYPPEYTKEKDKTSSDLNFQAIEDSNVVWSIQFNTKVSNAYILFTTTENQSDSLSAEQPYKKNRMEYNNKNHEFTFRRKIRSTQIYRIEVEKNNSTEKAILIDGIFTITISKDSPPKIKIINPKESLTEFSKTIDPTFTLEASISDDYDISNVVIQASVAKGSGESVKFRDKLFEFDRVENIRGINSRSNYRYTKNWSLNDLDMEPGDEVYFHVLASDNKKHKKQSTRSSSIIVRWLDDEELEVAAEGLRIGFVPEYFRSQRQIIIETIELIEDRNDLEISVFNERSVDLGHSQNDIKTKYGQYLGDEFGEGEGDFQLHESSSGVIDSEQGGEEHAHEFEEVVNESKLSNEQGNAAALIAEFTHNHSSIEIAPLSKQDPKTWMKMAVSEMWQAELHLMLSEPVKALPFEKKAYKYLKLARKADRIYAKRLGFEPPPVTEDRRLTGELDKVKSNTIDKNGFLEINSSQAIYRLTYKIINQWLMLDNMKKMNFMLSDSRLEVFRELKYDILKQTKTRPVLIKYVAILEQISITKTLLLPRCESCINDLQARLWNLITSSISIPKTRVRTIGISKENEKKYLNSFNTLTNNLKRNGESK